MEYGQRAVRLPKTPTERDQWRRAIVILEHCPIQQIQTIKGFELLREKHRIYHSKHGTDPAQWRPDVVHQCLLHLLDSPLSRSGRLQIFIRTAPGILVQVDPRLHVPRSMRLFEAMMTRLLFKLKVRSTTNQLQLLRVVKNPVTDHLPENTRYIRVERGGTMEDPLKFCQKLASTCGGLDPTTDKKARKNRASRNVLDDDDAEGNSSNEDEDDDDDDDDDEEDIPIWERGDANQGSEKHNMKPFAFVIGGMSRGDVDVEYCGKEETVSFSNKPMSAAAICSMLCHALETVWLEHDYSHATNVYNG